MSNLLIEASPRIAPDALRRLRHPIVWITVVGAVAGFAVAPSTEMPTAFALAVLLLLVGVSVPLTEFVQGRLDAMNLRNVFAFYYCYMFSGYFFYLALGNEAQYHIDWYKREASVVRAFILCIVGLVCFYVGFHLRVGELLSRRVPYFPRYWSARRMWLVYAASLAGGVMAFFVIMRAGGGISNYLTTINYSRVHAIGGKAYFFVALNMVATAGATTYVYGAARRSRWLRLLGIATLLMYAPLVMATGYRGPILFALIWFMALRHYYVKPLRVRLPAILLFASIILVFHSYAILRSVLTKATGSVVVAAIDAMTQPEFWLELPSIVVGREAGIEYVVRTMEGMRFVEEPPLGVDVVKEVISTPIPRAFWPDKIVPFSFRFTNTFYSDLIPPDGGGITPTTVGELYWNFRTVGVIVGCFLIGVMGRTIYEWFLARRDAATGVVYAVMAAFYFKLVSSLTLAFVDALANIAPLVLTLLIITYGGMTPRFYTRTKPSLASHLISKEV